ncbi:LamG domain-containing protein [Luteolibacter marinus]|uniref:LamG domain-containing protein n=1 Tax=Luteolibacter marinus TaxID=2776705 RepID=UPI001867A36E|nr:LamG domain-containing protein [Luteolibacter marinus]
MKTRKIPVPTVLLRLAGSVIPLMSSAATADVITRYALDESAGTSAPQSISGGAPDGTLVGPAAWVSGIAAGSAQALSLTTGSRVEVAGNDVWHGRGGFSVSTWIKPSQFAGGGHAARSIFWLGTAGGSARFTLQINDLGDVRVGGRRTGSETDFNNTLVAGTNVSGTTNGSAGDPIQLDQTYHLAATADYATGLLSLYVNGSPVASNTIGAWGSGVTASDQPFVIRIGSNATGGEQFHGVVDDLRLFNTALTPSEVAALAGPVATTRGRDPWAFRLTLENKTRMLVAALRPDLWVAYNPANGTLHKVWSGGIQFHGKVYDFGQLNSATSGTTYHLQKNAFLLSATDESVIPAGWSAPGISTGSSWNFSTGTGTMFVSPTVDLRHHDQVTLAYHTPGTNNRLLVDVSSDGGATWDAQNWMSVDGAVSDGHQKRLAVSGSSVKVRFRRNTTGSTATLADVTLFGDYRAWTVETGGNAVATTVDWRGYRIIDRTEGMVVRYDLVLPDGSRIGVEEQPEALAGIKLQRRFSLTGVPAGARVSLEIDGTGVSAGHQLNGAASLRMDGGATYLDFTASGEATLETTWTP